MFMVPSFPGNVVGGIIIKTKSTLTNVELGVKIGGNLATVLGVYKIIRQFTAQGMQITAFSNKSTAGFINIARSTFVAYEGMILIQFLYNDQNSARAVPFFIDSSD